MYYSLFMALSFIRPLMFFLRGNQTMTLQMIIGLIVVAIMIYLMAKRKDPKTLLFAAVT